MTLNQIVEKFQECLALLDMGSWSTEIYVYETRQLIQELALITTGVGVDYELEDRT